MIQRQINQGKDTYDSAREKRRGGEVAPDDVKIESGNEDERADPDFAMPQAEILAKRAGQSGLERRGIRQPIGEVNEPGGQEKCDGITGMNGQGQAV